MSRFSELSEYKSKFLREIILNDNIAKALVNNQSNFLDYEVEDPFSLIYSQVFPYQKIPTVTTDQKTYITMTFGGYRLINTTFKSGFITFYVFTHNELQRTDYGVLRTDYILNQIDTIFNEYNVGVGTLNFYAMDDIPINDTYIGAVIKYKVVDFN
jgi:hypothetical protein